MSGSRLEADDVVYLVTKLLKTKGFARNIVILTNDNDYLQIRDIGDNIYIYNMSNIDLTTRSVGSPSTDLLVKIMMGDVSDNIPPMCSKMGKKTALKLACMSQDERESFIIKQGIACVEQFAKNEQLISLKCIPMDLAQTCTSLYNIQIL
jgi:5'-3' exonuclease